MSRPQIAHNSWVVVCDGRKAFFLRNEGNAMHPRLKMEEEMHDGRKPASREPVTDRLRMMPPIDRAPRSSLEAPGYHDQQENRFLEKVSAELSRLGADNTIRSLVVVAAPGTLAELRHVLSAPVKLLVTAEIDMDFTGHPVREIERLLASV